MTAQGMETRQGDDRHGHRAEHDSPVPTGMRPNLLYRILLHLFPLLLHPKTEPRRVSTKLTPGYTKRREREIEHFRSCWERINRGETV